MTEQLLISKSLKGIYTKLGDLVKDKIKCTPYVNNDDKIKRMDRK